MQMAAISMPSPIRPPASVKDAAFAPARHGVAPAGQNVPVAATSTAPGLKGGAPAQLLSAAMLASLISAQTGASAGDAAATMTGT